MKNFWRNPENNPIKIVLLVIIIAVTGYFVFRYSHKNPLDSRGLVYGESSSGQFGAGIETTTGISDATYAVIVPGDFNEDGLTDLIYVDKNGGPVGQRAFFAGNGTGGFTGLTTSLATGFDGGAITAGDINEDGHLDLIIADSAQTTVTVSFGTGTGNFSGSATITIGITGQSGVAVGDMNEDSNLDIIVTNTGDNKAKIFYGDGVGGFSATPDVEVSVPTPGAITVGDFDEDGHIDFAIRTTTTDTTIIRNLGAGSFTSGATITATTNLKTYSIATADFNNDNNLDLAFVGTAGERVIYSGDGAGGFTLTTTTSAYASNSLFGVVAGDFDENGGAYMDLAAVMTGENNVVTFLNPPNPIPINVTSTAANGTYSAVGNSLEVVHTGDPQIIDITVQFNIPVVVDTSGGTPSIGIQVQPSATRHIVYSSGSGTDTLHFLYTVAPGDESLDLDYPDINSILLEFTSIKDALTGTKDALTELFVPGAAGSLGFNKNIVIDTQAPVVTQITPVSTPTTNHTPSYTFNTTEGGTITYSGGCTSATTTATLGSNTIVYETLADGTYSCKLTVTDIAGNISSELAGTSFTVTTASSGGGGGGGGRPIIPLLTEAIPVSTPTTNHTPNYTLSANESGVLTYGGGCSSNTTSINSGTTTITLNNLPAGTYSLCTIQLTDSGGTKSNILTVTSFTITDPVIPVTPPVDPIVPVIPTIKPTIKPKTNPTPIIKPKIEPIVPIVVPDVPSEPAPVIEVPQPAPTEPIVEEPIPTPPKQMIAETGCVYGNKTGFFGTISNEISWRYCQIKPYIIKLINSIQSIYNENNGDILLKILVILSLCIGGLIAILYGIFLDTLSFGEMKYVPGRLLSLFTRGLGFKKQEKMWGTVYDAITKKPLDPVLLTLWDGAGKKIKSTITNLSGKYTFGNLAPGAYTITATKHKYALVGDSLNGQDHDEVYRHLYYGNTFNVLAPGGPMLLNIPMQPENFEWSTFVVNGPRLMKSYAGSERLFFGLSSFFISFGFFAAVLLIIGTADIPNIILCALATLLYIIKPQTLCARAFGYITDGRSGDPLSFGIVRISSGVTGTDITDCVLDGVGKYSYPLPKGNYLLRVDRKNLDGRYHTLMKNIAIKTKKNVVAQSLIVTEAS